MYVKFLNDDGSSHYDPSFVYPLPTDTEPGAWVTALGPEPIDHKPCGPGRLHLCNSPVPRGGARWGVPYEAEGSKKIGGDQNKTSFRHVRLLRRIPLTEIFYPGADLSFSNFLSADLQGINLQGINFQGADFQEANLQEANFQKANLREANLQEANLQGANLQEASLLGTDLRNTNLQEANLQEADLRGAKLQGTMYTEYLNDNGSPY